MTRTAGTAKAPSAPFPCGARARRRAGRAALQAAAAALSVMAMAGAARAAAPPGQEPYQAFLAASDEQARLVKAVRTGLPARRRLAFSQAQTAWLTYRMRACAFEASAAERPQPASALQWPCALRLTEQRNAELQSLEACLAETADGCAGTAGPTR